jgi:hypothetical protein
MCKEEISACCLDNRKRKIIIGDINGEIKVYNPLNGSFMKACVHDIQSVVISLAYINSSRRFLAGYVNGVMRLYDETNLDDCQILRNFDRFNFHTELTSVLYLEADRTVITSGTIGEPVKLWEYDSGKCDMELKACRDTETIIAVITLDPFPLLATSDSAGNIVVWGSRGCKWRGDKVTGFKNQHPERAEMEAPLRTNGPRRIVPDEVSTSRDQDEDRDTSTRGGDMDTQTLATLPECGPEGSLQQPSTQSSSSMSMAAAAQQAEEELEACAKKWGPLSAATTLAWDSVNFFFYTADEQGTLRAFSLQRIIDELDGECMLHGAKSTAKDRRGSNRKASAQANIVSTGGPVIPYIFGKKRYTAKSSALYRWGIQAHRETVIYCKATPYGILTSSMDNKVKMWDIQGEEVGSLLSCAATGQRSVNWDLKLDIDAIMKKEEEHLDCMLDEVQKYSDETVDSYIAPNADDAIHTEIPDDKKTKFSRTSLRKRIEMSSRLLGLDFTNDQGGGDDQSDAESVVSMSQADDSSSMCSLGSKSTKNALDEARNIHNQSGLETKKDCALSVLQMRHKECSMNKMVKNFEERGISFPVLTNPNNPKQNNYGVVTEAGAASPQSQNKMQGGNLQEIEHEEKISKKCKKFSTYKNLEKCLGNDHLPPLTKDEREKIRSARKEQKKQRDLKESKKRLVKQKSKALSEIEASGDDDDGGIQED